MSLSSSNLLVSSYKHNLITTFLSKFLPYIVNVIGFIYSTFKPLTFNVSLFDVVVVRSKKTGDIFVISYVLIPNNSFKSSIDS